jgi:hypothetical protein
MADFDLDAMLASILEDAKPAPAVTITPPKGVTVAQDEPAPLPVVEIPLPSTMGPALKEPEVPTLPVTEAPERSLDELFKAEFPAPMEIPETLPAVAEEPEAPNLQPFADTSERTDPSYMPPAIGMPEFTTDEIAATLDLRNFATMTTLNTKRWHAKAKDRQAAKNASLATGASEDAFETRKRLLVGADEKLKRIHKAIDAARAKYYEMTLPWTTTGLDDVGRRSGARIMPNTQFFEFITEMGKHKGEMIAALDDFVPAYPSLVEQAKGNLKGSFDATEYPNAESIRHHFDLSFDFQPIPQGGDFKGLPDAQCQALADALAGKTKKMLENAMQDLWTRIHENVGRMAERLSHPDKLFHYTLVENVQSVARQLKHLNVTGDARIEDLRQYIEKHLCQHDVEELRKNPVLRAQTGAHAQEVLAKMATFTAGMSK